MLQRFRQRSLPVWPVEQGSRGMLVIKIVVPWGE